MNLHGLPDKNLLIVAFESDAEADVLRQLPAWRSQLRALRKNALPLIAIDAASGVAALSDWQSDAAPPLVLLAPPLSGISRAAGLQLIFDSFGYRRYNRPLGHDNVFSNQAYVSGHGMTDLADVEAHAETFAETVGVLAPLQPSGTIWDLHAPLSPRRLLANANTRVVHLVRDPRDVTVSAYFFFKRSTERAQGPFRASLTERDFDAAQKEEALIQLIDGGYSALSPAGFTRHRTPRQMLDAMAATLNEPRVFTLRYELQHTDGQGQYDRLIDWLTAAAGGKAPKDRARLVTDAIDRGTFAHQTGGAMVEGVHTEAPAASPTGHLRKGIVGDWRNHFTPAVARAFNDSVGGLLIECGFESDRDWWRNLT